MKALTIVTLLSGLFLVKVSFGASAVREISYNEYAQMITYTFKNFGEKPGLYVGEDNCQVTLQADRNMLVMTMYENGRIQARQVVRSTDRIFARHGNLYIEYRIGNQKFTLLSGDGMFNLIFGGLNSYQKSCGHNA